MLLLRIVAVLRLVRGDVGNIPGRETGDTPGGLCVHLFGSFLVHSRGRLCYGCFFRVLSAGPEGEAVALGLGFFEGGD